MFPEHSEGSESELAKQSTAYQTRHHLAQIVPQRLEDNDDASQLVLVGVVGKYLNGVGHGQLEAMK